MKQLHFRSFRQQLNAAFLAVSLIPLLLCSVLLVQIFRLRMVSDAQQTAQQQLTAALDALDSVHTGFQSVVDTLDSDRLVTQALFDEQAEDTKVYEQLFQATEALRGFAAFHLYDISGNWRYSTQSAPESKVLSTHWLSLIHI